MSGDLNNLSMRAMRLADRLGGVRACLVMSNEDRAVGVHPSGEDAAARSAWDRLRGMGDLTRGYLAMADELWAVARGESLAALVMTDASRDPEVLLAELARALADEEKALAEQEAREAMPADEVEPAMAMSGDDEMSGGQGRELDTVALSREFSLLMDDGHLGEQIPH